MDRNATNDRQWFAALGTVARELSDAELDAVSGGTGTTTANYSKVTIEMRKSGSDPNLTGHAF